MIKDKLENIIKNNVNVVDFDLDEDDLVSDFDYLVTFDNVDAVDKIYALKFEIEDKLDVSVKLLVEQIDDQIDEGGALVTVDFYCDIIR